MTWQNTRYQKAQFARHIALVEFCHSPGLFVLPSWVAVQRQRSLFFGKLTPPNYVDVVREK